MVTNEIYDYLQTEKGVIELYKKFEKCFKTIDELSDTFLHGDLLDENELANALLKVLHNKTLCNRLSINGKETAHKFSIQNIATQYQQVFEQIIKNSYENTTDQ